MSVVQRDIQLFADVELRQDPAFHIAGVAGAVATARPDKSDACTKLVKTMRCILGLQGIVRRVEQMVLPDFVIGAPPFQTSAVRRKATADFDAAEDLEAMFRRLIEKRLRFRL
ncbi:hypothetical protein PE067_14060 [Paracoccus sp. DMF-8]|uniref:hypothetical protein n=1 Tax=Paracoccus sp. DMF-8 TaxID=3019445 RepID=UPI0023E8D96F|nr:hypothetical protein [Paracoccus sp. DMF-8]MDF3607160.1 hypothetical protein [Paracoccus sp. DMF-8]